MAKKPTTIKEPAAEASKAEETKADTGKTEEKGMTEEQARWSRLLPMLVLILCFGLAEAVLYLVAVIQFVWVAIYSEKNVNLTKFGKTLSIWLGDNAQYLTYNTEERPFPWKAWPKG